MKYRIAKTTDKIINYTILSSIATTPLLCYACAQDDTETSASVGILTGLALFLIKGYIGGKMYDFEEHLKDSHYGYLEKNLELMERDLNSELYDDEELI